MTLKIDPHLVQSPDPVTRPLIEFVRLMTQNSPEFKQLNALPTSGSLVAELDGWAVEYVMDEPSPKIFGRFHNCNAERRCAPCQLICQAESAELNLSVRAHGLAAMRVYGRSGILLPAVKTVATFVPASPASSGVWVPILCGKTQQVLLAATSGDRLAKIAPHGRFLVCKRSPGDGDLQAQAEMFQMTWRLQFADLFTSRSAAPVAGAL